MPDDPALTSFHAIIPAGGAGTRLWPLSRASRPKFLLDLDGSGRSLLQQTWDRLVDLIPAERIHVVTGTAHAGAIGEQLPELTSLIVEPSPRDSMPAIGLAGINLVVVEVLAIENAGLVPDQPILRDLGRIELDLDLHIVRD